MSGVQELCVAEVIISLSASDENSSVQHPQHLLLSSHRGSFLWQGSKKEKKQDTNKPSATMATNDRAMFKVHQRKCWCWL